MVFCLSSTFFSATTIVSVKRWINDLWFTKPHDAAFVPHRSKKLWTLKGWQSSYFVLEWPQTYQTSQRFIIMLLIFSSSVSPLQHWDISQTKIRVISTLLFVLFGCLLFVALPAAIFKHIEGWSALESLYFVVITLTTIGFGDFVAGTHIASDWMSTLKK